MKIAVGLSGQQVLGRFFDLPPMPAKKVADATGHETRHQVPMPLEELCWASHVQDAIAGKAADESARRILVVAARSSHVRERMGTFKSAGLQPDLVTSDCLALHNALVHEMFGDDDQPAAICALDVGAACTSVVVSSPKCIWFRTFGQGGDAVTSQLVRQLILTKEQAEKLKRDPSQARRYGLFRDAIQPAIEQLASEIERSLASHARLFPDHPVQHTYGLGGAFQTQGLLRQLRFGK
jgi:Tfp pilus assembly PilM family ATPase